MKTFAYASTGAVFLVLAAALLVFYGEAKNDAGGAAIDGSRPGAAAADAVGSFAGGTRARGGTSADPDGPSSAATRRAEALAARARAYSAPGHRSGAGNGSSGVSGGASTKGSPDADELAKGLVRSGPLAGATLTAAIEAALEAEDLSTLQGLLISELTMEGTRFAPEDAPALLDALQGVDDYGMEKLILTHLDRIDAPPEDLVGGYLDYLESSKKPGHMDEVLDRIVKVGGEAATQGLTELVRGTEHENLRRRAAMALAETGDPRATPAIREALLRTSSPEEARHYLSALARVADEPALSTLFDYVSRAGTDTALRALREVRNKDAAPHLAGELDPRGDATFQRALLRKLREFHDPRSLSELDRYLDRAPKPMMFEALKAVEGITDERAARLLEQFAGRADDPKLSQWALRSAARVRQKIAKAEQKGAGKPDKPKRPKTPRPDRGEKREQKESRRNGRTG